MRLTPILLVILALTMPLQAFASPQINDEGAARVKALVEKMISSQRVAYNSTSSQFVTEGDLKIEQADTYYAVTLPDISVVMQAEKNGETEKLITKIGIIGINVVPTDNPKEWKMSMAIPTPIKYLKEDLTPLMKMDIGGQQMVGIWNEDLNNYSKLNANYSNIIINNNDMSGDDKNIRITMGDLSVKSNLQETSGLWSGKTNVGLSNFKVEAPNDSNPEKMFVKNIKIDGSIKDFSAEAQQSIETMMSGLQDNADDPTAYNALWPSLMNLMDSTAFKISMDDLQIVPGKDSSANEKLALKQAFIGFDITGIKEKMLSHNASFGWHGLSGAQGQLDQDNIIPSTGSFAFSLENLPLTPLITMGQQLASSGANKNNIAQMAMMNAMMSLPQKLSEAGTTISIKDTMLKHPSFRLNIDGKMQATQDSIIGAAGKATIKILGLENLMTLLGKNIDKAPENKKARFAGYLENLEKFKSLAKVDSSNAQLRTIELELDKQGQTLINGQNMQEAMMGAAQEAQAQ